MEMRALLIPADPTKPVSVIDLNAGPGSLKNLQGAVGGYVEVQAHAEGDLWLNEEGRLIDLPINVRANRFLLSDSQLAKEHEVSERGIMYGDVVMTGPPDREGDSTPVSQEMIDYFSGLQLSKDSMRDWDIRTVEVELMEWPEPGDDGIGL